MDTGELGRLYGDGEVIVRQGEEGDCMFVVQEGQVEVVVNTGGREVRLAVRGEREFFGEMSIFEKAPRMATVRALGRARVLRVDRRNFLQRIHDDPSLAYRLVQSMSRRIRDLSNEVAQLKGG